MSIGLSKFSGLRNPIESLRTADYLLISDMAAKNLKIANKKFRTTVKKHLILSYSFVYSFI